jgi:hypothetical protein
VGGYSYQRPIELMKEAMRVQRSVLEMGYPRILLSATYRMVNTLGLRALTMVPLYRRAGRSARPPLVGAG